MKQKFEIFLSYNWENETVAERIYIYLKSSPMIKLHKDKIDINSWGSIKEYMNSIQNVDYTILLISDEYLKSINCMYEVLEVMKDRKYENKIFPAVISKSIYTSIGRAKYVKYWKNKYEELHSELKELEPHEIGNLGKDLKEIQDIKSNIAEFLDKIAYMNNPRIEDVSVQIEEKIKQKFDLHIEKNKYVSTESNNFYKAELNSKKIEKLSSNVKYSLYGISYEENQSDMMLRVFAQVLKRHEDKIRTLPQIDGMNCVLKFEDINKPNTKYANPIYFRTCKEFQFSDGQSICVGTSYDLNTKLKKIARLLEICNEDKNVFQSNQVIVPNKVTSQKVKYKLFGNEYSGDQTEMMSHVCSTMIDKYPQKFQNIIEGTLCIGLNDRSLENSSYFRTGRVYTCGNSEYKVGTSFSLQGKIREIEKVFMICKEDLENFHIEGNEKSFISKKEKNFLD